MRDALLSRLRLLLIYALVAAIYRERFALREAARREDMGYDDCPVCIAARTA